jgi:hypothetical protein
MSHSMRSTLCQSALFHYYNAPTHPGMDIDYMNSLTLIFPQNAKIKGFFLGAEETKTQKNSLKVQGGADSK